MKRFILAAVTAFALAGAAVAQPSQTPAAPMASGSESDIAQQAADLRAAQAHDLATENMMRSVQASSSQVHMACAADRARLCADRKTTFGSDRCLEGHRKDLAGLCRAALSQAAMAWNIRR